MAQKTVRFTELREQPYGIFHVTSSHPIEVRHIKYTSMYHYLLAQKFKGTEIEAKIRSAPSLWDVERFARNARDNDVREDWEEVKNEVMLTGCYYKFKQHLPLQTLLLGTGNKVIVFHTATDNYWGDGGDGTGSNMLGVILMAVRKKLWQEIKPGSAQGNNPPRKPLRAKMT
eukprot:TRINITY_DN3781_c0_g1_i1.p1 TRINITY_DN3781_c0_g1~~TRINITY_DN3781_c0_g1_i1.p1  ORF type:complete len:172 (-),score=30.27 TRINITY_DN3781_c0_g1_i1:16-531(-)